MEQQMILSADVQSAELIRCIDACDACHRICLKMVMNHCLEIGGDYVEPGHFRSMTICAEVCRTTSDAMLSSFAYHEVLCEACSRVCRRCAESCESLGMQECVAACQSCADACERIIGVERDARRPGFIGP
jgi:hypothetical protein